MADIVLSSKRKINFFDRVIQSVVIMVNMNKMNRAIDEHLETINKCEKEEQKQMQENILREIVFVKYQYDIMQRQMYELRLSYPDEIIDNINSTDKTERLKLQKLFLEMEYDRITKLKFKSKDGIKYGLLIISSVIEDIKQDIKDEGKSQRYNNVIKLSENIDSKIEADEYTEALYKELFLEVDNYVDYINDNYDISKLPSDERELIEFVIETTIKGIESDIDRYMYEYNIIIKICKSSYRYFKVIDKIFEKIQQIYDESLEKEIVSLKDYVRFYKDIYDSKIKTKVNDVHRSIQTEDEYLEYTKLLANLDYDNLDTFINNRAYESTKSDFTKNVFAKELGLIDDNGTDVDVEEKAEELLEEKNESNESKELKVEKDSKFKKILSKKIDSKELKENKTEEEPKKRLRRRVKKADSVV